MSAPTNMPPEYSGDTSSIDITKKFEFTGEMSQMWPIIFKNLIFNILTLSLYRFWGRTNVRRFLWQNIRFMGDPLEYTGTGKELFVGFLITFVAIFIPLFGLIIWAQTLIQQQSSFGFLLFSLVYILMLFLLLVGMYKAHKYRLSRTRWRGIRAGLEEGGFKFAFYGLGYYMLTVLTLGLLMPFVDNKLYSYQANRSRFGTAKLSYRAKSGPLYSAFFLSILIMIGVIVLLFLVLGVSALTQVSGGNASVSSIITLLLVYMIYIGGIGLAFTIYNFAQLKHFWGNTNIVNSTFVFEGTLKGLILTFLGNLLIIVITLGIAYPIAQMRLVRFITNNLSLSGNLNLSKIQQTSGDNPEFGEGLAEGFDMGTI